MMVGLKVAAPMPIVQKLQRQIFVVAPDQNHLILRKQVKDECAQRQSLCASVKQITTDDQLVWLRIFKIALFGKRSHQFAEITVDIGCYIVSHKGFSVIDFHSSNYHYRPNPTIVKGFVRN